MTMEEQLELKDLYGMTVLMHAASSGNQVVFGRVTSHIPRFMVRFCSDPTPMICRLDSADQR